jgi:cobalt/nickel transport system permease protein
MHIPDNYLSPSTCGVMTAVMVPIWAYSLKKIKEEMPQDRIPLLGVGAAFAFLLMMFNIPLPGGTTGHAVGGTLIAILFGPYAACIAVSIALLIQAVLFGDGGILSFGANCFNMAFILPFTGYGIYKVLSRLIPGAAGEKAGILIGSYIGIVAASFCAAVEFGIQPMLFTDAAGQALYCPYPLGVSIPAMVIPHMLVAGIVEAAFTLAIYSFIQKSAPSLVQSQSQNASTGLRPIYGLLTALVICTPLGLWAEGDAWGEWSPEDIADVAQGGQTLGYTPHQMLNGFNFNAIMPDYSVAGLPDAAGYILSAIAGTALLIIIFKLIGTMYHETLPSK